MNESERLNGSLSQKQNEIQRKTTSSLVELNQKELQALQLKYFGKTSGEIAEATGYNENYVRNLFMRGGRLERAYNDFALKQQDKTQTNVDMALSRARDEALQAIERVIALSKDARNEAAIFKANEFLLALAGVGNQATLRGSFQNKTYEQAKAMVEELFKDIFQKSLAEEHTRMVIYYECEHCGKPTKQIGL